MMNVRRVFAVVILVVGVIGLTGGMSLAQENRGAFFAVLSGGNEVTNGGLADAGDPNGYGSATVLVIGTTTLCYAVLVDRISPPVAMHIHGALAGVNGDIVIALTPPASGNPGAISECLEDQDPVILRSLRMTPAQFYVNVHTGQFPGGAVRGQLH